MLYALKLYGSADWLLNRPSDIDTNAMGVTNADSDPRTAEEPGGTGTAVVIELLAVVVLVRRNEDWFRTNGP